MQFISSLKEKYYDYNRWLKFEIEYLSEVEKKQRHQKEPEYIRIFKVIFDNFTIINMGYSLLTLISIIRYIQFALHCQGEVKNYPIWPDLNASKIMDAEEEQQKVIEYFFGQIVELLNEQFTYSGTVTLAYLFAILKLFEYFEKSKNMQNLIKVLSTAQYDTRNFMIIFICFVLGMTALAHLSFGTFNYQFASIMTAFRSNFEMSLWNLQVYFVFLDRSIKTSLLMSYILFVGGTTIFVFLFSNIFLAIMMNSYEINVGQYKNLLDQNKSKKDD